MSSFSPHPDMSVSSPDSPALKHPFRPMYAPEISIHGMYSTANLLRSTGSLESGSLRPSSAAAARSSPAPFQLLSPSDVVGPSPVTSVGTEATEIEDEASDETRSNAEATNPEHYPQVGSDNVSFPQQQLMLIVVYVEDQYTRSCAANGERGIGLGYSRPREL